jgi:Raf kinase inhibitor-like YbhB/YbcL family protein
MTPPVFPPPETVPPATTALVEPTSPPEPTAPPETSPAAPLELLASWQDGAEIPVRQTCDGDDVSPALTWANVPDGTAELAITVVDLDAAGYVHWILFGIDPQRTSLTEDETPLPGYEWTNTAGVADWTGPCPPPGEQHLYQFTIHALNQQLEVADDAPATEVISLINLIAIDQGSVTGTFVRTE